MDKSLTKGRLPGMKRVDVVGAVIWNEAGEVLCALRSAQMAMPGLWEFPGGKIEPGEDPRETLRREIAEELGCVIEVGGQVADVTHAYPDLEVRLITFHARVVEGQPAPREHERLRWVRPEALGNLTWAPADLPTVDRLVKGAARC